MKDCLVFAVSVEVFKFMMCEGMFREVRKQFRLCEDATGFPFANLMIVASDCIGIDVLTELNEQVLHMDSASIQCYRVETSCKTRLWVSSVGRESGVAPSQSVLLYVKG